MGMVFIIRHENWRSKSAPNTAPLMTLRTGQANTLPLAALGDARRDGVCASFEQSGSLHGLKLVPSKWRCLIPEERRDGAQSHPPATTHRALRRREPLGAKGLYVYNCKKIWHIESFQSLEK